VLYDSHRVRGAARRGAVRFRGWGEVIGLLCFVMFCFVLFSYAMLWSAMLCYAFLWVREKIGRLPLAVELNGLFLRSQAVLRKEMSG